MDPRFHRSSARSCPYKRLLVDWVAISVQVLQELHVNFEKRGISHADAAQIIRDCSSWPVVDDSLDLLQKALDEQDRRQVSLWDALILAATRASGVAELVTEDLDHGHD